MGHPALELGRLEAAIKAQGGSVKEVKKPEKPEEPADLIKGAARAIQFIRGRHEAAFGRVGELAGLQNPEQDFRRAFADVRRARGDKKRSEKPEQFFRDIRARLEAAVKDGKIMSAAELAPWGGTPEEQKNYDIALNDWLRRSDVGDAIAGRPKSDFGAQELMRRRDVVLDDEAILSKLLLGTETRPGAARPAMKEKAATAVPVKIEKNKKAEPRDIKEIVEAGGVALEVGGARAAILLEKVNPPGERGWRYRVADAFLVPGVKVGDLFTPDFSGKDDLRVALRRVGFFKEKEKK